MRTIKLTNGWFQTLFPQILKSLNFKISAELNDRHVTSFFSILTYFWNLNFLESVGIKFETNHCLRSFHIFKKLELFSSMEFNVKWGASSWWSSSLCCPMRRSDEMTIGKTHPALVCLSVYIIKFDPNLIGGL